jgi:hypothetical protein
MTLFTSPLPHRARVGDVAVYLRSDHVSPVLLPNPGCDWPRTWGVLVGQPNGSQLDVSADHVAAHLDERVAGDLAVASLPFDYLGMACNARVA